MLTASPPIFKPLIFAALSGVKIYESVSDFIRQLGFGANSNPDQTAKFWVDASTINNPDGYRPTRFNGYTGRDEPGYLVPALRDGKAHLAPFVTEYPSLDGRTVPIRQLDMKWRIYTANQTRMQFYRDYEAYFPGGVPYLEPLEAQLERLGRELPGIEENLVDNAVYRIPFPVALRDDYAMRVNGAGQIEVFSIYDFIATNPKPNPGPRPTLEAGDLIRQVYAALTDVALTAAQKAAKIRDLAAK